MKNFAFISRHEPTASQHSIAAQHNIILHPVGDRDGFTVKSDEFAPYDGVIVAHAAMALRLLTPINYVGIFNNVNRAGIGEPPRFEATELHLYYIIGNQIGELK